MRARRLLRNAYHRLFKRSLWRQRVAKRQLFAQFVDPGSVVFDIGACYGQVAEVLIELGARVVAVEPNPIMAEAIARLYGDALVIENVAVGSKPGKATLSVGPDPNHSTLSSDWKERAPTEGRWERTVSVDVKTLDELIGSYGRPDFIKIDVEAYEAEVLAGLSEPVGALSFEYQGAYVEVTHQCLDRLGDEFTYALTRAEEPVFVTPWLDAAGVRTFLVDVGPSDYGDVFARRLATVG